MTRRVHRHEVCDSTNERALAGLEAGEARHGDVYLADSQTAGRGQRGNAWHSPPGQGLYLSLVWAPGSPVEPAGLTMGAGLALLRTVQGLGLERATLKWPNDLVVGEAKLAGILVEARGLDPRAPRAVVGVGLNVGQRSFPAALLEQRAVTSLALEGVAVEPDEVLETLLPALEAQLERAHAQPRELSRDYARATGLLGRRVRVRAPGQELLGELLDLDLTDGLRLGRDDGGTVRLALAHVRGVRLADASGPDGPSPVDAR